MFCSFAALPALAKVSLLLLTEEYPPYNYSGSDGIAGLNYDILVTACQNLSYQCDFKLVTWSRALGEAKNNPYIGAFSTSRIPSREPHFKWVGPLETDQLGLFKLRSRHDIIVNANIPVQTYSVGVVRGAVTKKVLRYHGWQNAKNIVEFSSVEDFYKPFFAGRFDLIPGSPFALPYTLPNYGFKFSDIQQVYDFGPDQAGNYLALNINVADQVVKAMNKEIAILRNGGWVQKRRQYYQSRAYEIAVE